MHLVSEQARAVLTLIQQHAPSAFFAGGAMRDAWFGRPAKDLDFFVPYLDGHNSIHSALIDAGYECTVIAAMQYFADDPTVADARLYEQPGLLPVNIIRLHVFKALPDALDRFDLGFCQIGFDGERVHTTNAFALDAVDLTVTLTRCDSWEQFVRTNQRVIRLRERYREFTFVVPEKFKEMGL